ncbi:MAG TPA: hypothetical protein VFV99_17635 [Kofleriaceae bacterium]|nr:hypothetical protein [Kofleriaceae bacterium]
MAELRPCTECRRHVAIDERACPFCNAELTVAAPSSTRLGRVSRAAVFAGAALATTACGGKKPKTDTNVQDHEQTASGDAGVEQPPPPPPDDKNNVPMPYGAPPARKRVV